MVESATQMQEMQTLPMMNDAAEMCLALTYGYTSLTDIGVGRKLLPELPHPELRQDGQALVKPPTEGVRWLPPEWASGNFYSVATLCSASVVGYWL